jgi:EAL domain-containing protein (putative c-di-GMP-specific phosphodiesterase class I)
MLGHQLVDTVFQPIVCLRTGTSLGFESLGRGSHLGLSPNPSELFDLAERCQLAAELSRSFRLVAIREACRLPGLPRLFFNLHPDEMANERLLDSLAEIVAILGDGKRMVLEVHEDVVADPATMRRLRECLQPLGVGLAYDDFGSGQARLAELADAPPDFVKLDMKLVRKIDCSRPRQELVQALTHVCNDLGVQVIAEGIETLEEAQACLVLGCAFGQGFLFGRPRPASAFIKRKQATTCRIPIGPLKQARNSENS